MTPTRAITAAVAALALTAPACGKKHEENKDKPAQGATGTGQGAAAGAGEPAADLVGVEVANKVVTIGALNDESGPAAAIGVPFANGKRLLVKKVNAGGVLPEGWTVKLVEKDHGYNPQQSVQQYNAIKDDVLFLTTSFGTPNTLPLRDMLAADGIVAFPASLSSQMAEHANTPPLGASYKLEAERAMDWAVAHAGGADQVKAGIVYQEDDYGADGHAGWKAAAEHLGVTIVAAQTVTPKQTDFTAVVAALKKAGADYVLLTILPTATAQIVGTAAQLKYEPAWIASTPAWMDQFFDAIPEKAMTRFYWVTGLTYWGEDVPGMGEFLDAWASYGRGMGKPNFYILSSYVAGLVHMEALRRAIESGDLSRAGFMKALQSIEGFTAGGLGQPVTLTQVPYVTGTRTRILRPVYAKRSWELVADWAVPSTMGGGEHPGGSN